MAVTLRFSVYGDDQINRTLARFEAPEDSTALWEALAADFLKIEKRQFGSEGRYASGGWSPLEPNYARWKAANYPGKTILRRTDELYRSLTVGPQIRIITPGFMVLGSSVPYGEYHQRGIGQKRRRPVELTESTRRDWIKAMQRFCVTGEARVRGGGATGLAAAGTRST